MLSDVEFDQLAGKPKPRIIALDFDGCVVTHAYPEIGKDAGAIPWLERLQAAGHKIVLHTMRDNETLAEAVTWLRDRGVIVDTLTDAMHAQKWSRSQKLHANLYIDDMGAGMPLKWLEGEKRPVVDWDALGAWLDEYGWLD